MPDAHFYFLFLFHVITVGLDDSFSLLTEIAAVELVVKYRSDSTLASCFTSNSQITDS